MFQILIAIYFILIIAMVISIRIIRKSSIMNQQSMVWLIDMGIVTATSYTLSLLVPTDYQSLAVCLNGVYFIGTDWLAIALMFFVADYTSLHPPTKMPKYILIALAVVDSASLFVNTFTRHVFTMERTMMGWAGYWQAQYEPLQFIHLGFVYLMVAYCIFLLAYRLAVAPKIYKEKYAAILILLSAVIVLNVVCVTLQSKFDYSVLIYGLLAVSICYYVVYASPKRLLNSMHAKLAEDSVIGMIVFDDNNRCVGVNRAIENMFGRESVDYSAAEQYLAKWEEDFNWQMENVMGAERAFEVNGEMIYLYVNYQKLRDKKGRILGSCFQIENRTELVKQYQEEKYRSTHDMLTGLLNRKAFEIEAGKILAKADEPYYMVCTNLKDFKLVNELYGAEMGDALLIAQANLIRGEEHGNSVSSRIYADKFCTLLPKRHFDEEGFKERMLTLLERELVVPLKAHFYLGIYEITDVTEPIWTMCDKAMMAIDAIRGNYGQISSYYREEMFRRILREKEILGRFDKALEDQEFHMFLQPQITNDGRVVGAEALVRWISPDKGMISPADFIPVLEKVGLIHKLDLYMWEKAAQKLQEWKREGKNNLSISVNISTQDFYLIDIYEAFHELSKKYDFDIKNLKLEITESALMKDVRRIMRNMDELHALGYDIEIDDFGSGYSSLGMLKDIRADILKIDMIFLQETVNVDRSTTIIKNVIAMSKELGMPVVTEGVETKEQVDFLQKAGCDMFQGFYFARPMSVENFEQTYPM